MSLIKEKLAKLPINPSSDVNHSVNVLLMAQATVCSGCTSAFYHQLSTFSAACLPLCLDASSSPPRWDILTRRVADLLQVCVGKVGDVSCSMSARTKHWQRICRNSPAVVDGHDVWHQDKRVREHAGEKLRHGAEGKNDYKWRKEAETEEQVCRRSALHSPLSQPGSSSSFLLCDSSGRRKTQKSN